MLFLCIVTCGCVVCYRLRLQVKEVEGGEEKKVLPIHELDSLQLSLFVCHTHLPLTAKKNAVTVVEGSMAC